jgi:uncharacterized protein YndB with AHSA1/START domain/DNA-binding transcriptional ArsR family regulator
MDDVFKALADPHRRRLLDRLNAHNGQTLRELCQGLDLTRQSVSKHLGVLEDANLVSTLRRGREKLHYLNPEPINTIADRWIHHYDRGRLRALADLKTALEAPPMAPEFVYTTYIKTTPERLWQALTAPEFTRRYWGVTFDTDWAKGSVMTWLNNGVTVVDPEQVVLESDPYHRLSYTWHTFTPELTSALNFDDDFAGRVTAEARSRVAFDLEPHGQLVKLTIVHDGFAPDSAVLTSISGGWPIVMSSLKTLLETGARLPDGAGDEIA